MASFSKQEKGRLGNRGNHRSQDNPTRVRSGNQQDGATNKPPSGNEASSETNDKLRVLQHWFLLESDWVDAINKGNHSLIPAALARVDLLCIVVCPDLLKEGLKGEEEALWSIHESLYNNGWWERVRNLDLGRKNWSKKDAHSDLLLNNFMSSYERFVDPNVQLMVKQGSQEGFRMALNHIHYGSIRESRENGMRNNHSSSSVSQHQAPAKHTSQGNSYSHLAILKSFLLGYKHIIEPSVLDDALSGNDKALSLALGQIHHKSLAHPSLSEPSFKEKLLLNINENKSPARTTTIRSPKSVTPETSKNTVFFTGFSNSTNLKDLWVLFKRVGKIKDIILPRRRDRFGNRIGFIIATNGQEAEKMISQFNGMHFDNGFYI